MKIKELYVIVEDCVVCAGDDGDGLENEAEPVVCMPLGFFVVEDEAVKIAHKHNEECGDERYYVRSMSLR